MEKISNDELDRIVEENIQDTGSDYKIGCYNNFINGYRTAEAKHLKTINKLQAILAQHRIIIDALCNEK